MRVFLVFALFFAVALCHNHRGGHHKHQHFKKLRPQLTSPEERMKDPQIFAQLEQRINSRMQKDENGEFYPYCATEDLYHWRRDSLLVPMDDEPQCKQFAKECEKREIRDKYLPSLNPTSVYRIRLAFQVVCDDKGTCPQAYDGKPFSVQYIKEAIEQLKEDWGSTGIEFTVDLENGVHFHNNSQFTELSPYGVSNDWFFELLKLKTLYGGDFNTQLNVFVTGQTRGNYGTLLGIGTFPWDPAANTPEGGLWMNAAFVGTDRKTLSHEIGHNIGLWHTFHGVTEVSCTSDCFEKPHSKGAISAAELGDFVESTDATPVQYQCSTSASSPNPICGKKTWSLQESDIKNIMSYTPDTCMAYLQKEQAARGRCWTCFSPYTKGQLINHSQVCNV